MTEPNHTSVNELLAELHATRVASWPEADLEVNVNQRKLLVETADRARFVKAGDVLDAFDLPEVEGGAVSIDGLLQDGPVVLLFFRFAGCPACNVALPHYRDALHPGLVELGATLVGVSPQVPGDLLEIKVRHRLAFPIASDTDNALARTLGIAYAPDEASRRYALAKGADVGRITGTGRWEFPMPALVVVDAGRVVRFADVSPDWMVRTEAEVVLDAVRALSPARAAGVV
jgi:peroxiredoxin